MVGQPERSAWDKLQSKDAQLGILSMSLLVSSVVDTLIEACAWF